MKSKTRKRKKKYFSSVKKQIIRCTQWCVFNFLLAKKFLFFVLAVCGATVLLDYPCSVSVFSTWTC